MDRKRAAKRDLAGRYRARVRSASDRLRSSTTSLARRRRPRKEGEAADLIPRLEQAVAGLLYPSETDAPVQVFAWREATPFSEQALLVSSGHDEKTPVKTTGLDQFFRPVTTPRSWHGEEEQQRTRRFAVLRELLEAELDDLMVYKIGSLDVEVYVVGRTAEGTYCGIKTRVVET